MLDVEATSSPVEVSKPATCAKISQQNMMREMSEQMISNHNLVIQDFKVVIVNAIGQSDAGAIDLYHRGKWSRTLICMGVVYYLLLKRFCEMKS
ncbi:MAG: hypothetical protein ACREBS_00015 [Nitrososphaerales archaeon]